VKDLDREVLALVAEDLLELLLEDLARPVMRIDDLIADLVLDQRRFTGYLEFLCFLLPGCV
jgi:hypothetical protein